MMARASVRATVRQATTGVLALCLLTLTACTGPSSGAGQSAPTAAGPSGSYTVPAEAQALCSELTNLAALTAVPDAIATLATTPDDAAARTELVAASARAKAIAKTAGAAGRFPEIAAAAQALGNQVDLLAGQPVTADAIALVASALDVLGAAVQPVCSMPT